MLSRALLLWERKTIAEATVHEPFQSTWKLVMIYGVIIVLFLGNADRGNSLSIS